MRCMETCQPPRLEIRPGVWIDTRRALWLAELRILVVADLHWGYADSHRAQGNLIPGWGDAEIAGRLRALIADYQPREMIWLGDSLHTPTGRVQAEAFLTEASIAITIISGNHDARWKRAHGCRSISRGPYFLHHGDRPEIVSPAAIEIVGHHHPALSWSDGAGTRLKLPALIASERRLVLPAFSPWAAGAPWNASLPGEVLYAISSKRIFTVAPVLPQKVTEI
jgi:metallophosphoesterase superfamily enzyme